MARRVAARGSAWCVSQVTHTGIVAPLTSSGASNLKHVPQGSLHGCKSCYAPPTTENTRVVNMDVEATLLFVRVYDSVKF